MGHINIAGSWSTFRLLIKSWNLDSCYIKTGLADAAVDHLDQYADLDWLIAQVWLVGCKRR